MFFWTVLHLCVSQGLLSSLAASSRDLNAQTKYTVHHLPSLTSHAIISQTPTLKLTLWEKDSLKSCCSIHVVKPSKVKAENVWSVFFFVMPAAPTLPVVHTDIKDTHAQRQNICSLWSYFNCWSHKLFVNPTDLQLHSWKQSFLICRSLFIPFIKTW